MSAAASNLQGRRATASRSWEAQSAQEDLKLLDAARTRWRALLPEHQMELARCLADCRRSELTRRHRNVVAVTAGLKRSANAAGEELLHSQPCVVFVVRRKLAPQQLARQPSQLLPTEVLTPAWVDGREQVVAVPTDVQREKRLLGGRAQADTAFAVGAQAARGSLTWGFVPAGGTAMVVAPLHVLSPRPTLDGVGLRSGELAKALNPAGNSSIGTASLKGTQFGGRVVPDNTRSFDVQLAEVLDVQRVRSAFGALRLSTRLPWVRSEAELDQLLAAGRPLEIHVPGNNPRRQNSGQPPLLAERSLVEQDLRLEYDFADGSRHNILHRVLELQVRFGQTTLRGDSGCPVLLPNDDDDPTFVGMHIAGNEAAFTSYIVPAWRILGPGAYEEVGGSMPPGPWQLQIQI